MILRSEIKVMRYTHRTDFDGCYQRLERWFYVLGVRVWRHTLRQEDIPSWAVIQRCCFGYTEWRSRTWRMGEWLKRRAAA